jgi:sensor histidine kinase YesM
MALELLNRNTKGYRIMRHILFWSAFVLFYALLYGSFEDNYGEMLILQLIYLPPKMIATYLVIYFLMPQYLLKSRYSAFLGWLALILLVTGFMHRAAYRYFEIPILNWGEDEYSLFYFAKIIKSTISIYPVVAIAVLIKLFQSFYKTQKQTQKLAQDKLEAELKFLKAQIHPHFLFNTLNNLYALTLKKSNIAPEIVLKLSDLLNYMLYECNAPRVPLRKEVDLIRNYISLEELRYGSRLKVDYMEEGNVRSSSIAPMILLPFVENAFKHGVSGQTEGAWVRIYNRCEEQQLTFSVENSKNNSGVQDSQGYTEGIGLKNVRRRLDLLYNGEYKLEVQDDLDVYKVRLTLNLAHEN